MDMPNIQFSYICLGFSNSLIAQWGYNNGNSNRDFQTIILPISYKQMYKILLTTITIEPWGCCKVIRNQTLTTFDHNGQNAGGTWSCNPCDYFTIGY